MQWSGAHPFGVGCDAVGSSPLPVYLVYLALQAFNGQPIPICLDAVREEVSSSEVGANVQK